MTISAAMLVEAHAGTLTAIGRHYEAIKVLHDCPCNDPYEEAVLGLRIAQIESVRGRLTHAYTIAATLTAIMHEFTRWEVSLASALTYLQHLAQLTRQLDQPHLERAVVAHAVDLARSSHDQPALLALLARQYELTGESRIRTEHDAAMNQCEYPSIKTSAKTSLRTRDNLLAIHAVLHRIVANLESPPTLDAAAPIG